MKALLLAGGLGTRLRPLTENLPKPMTPVFNRPWLEQLVLHLKDQGITQFVMALKYHADQIRALFGSGEKVGVHIEYAYERELLGTAGAIKNAESMLSDRFLVFNADIIHQVNLISLLEFHQRHGGLVTIGLTEVEDPSHYGVVQQTETGKIVRFIEKPPRDKAPSNRINAGIYVIEKEALKWIPEHRETSIERDTFPKLIDGDLGVYGALVKGYWMDMGTLDRYLQLHKDILNRKFPLRLSLPMERDGEWIGRVQVKRGAKIIPPVAVADGAVIESDCTIGPFTIIGEDAVIGAGSTVSNTVVWPETYIAPGSRMTHSIVSQWFAVDIPKITSSPEAVVQS